MLDRRDFLRSTRAAAMAVNIRANAEADSSIPDAIARLVGSRKAAGISCASFRGGQIVWKQAFGMANAATGTPMRTQTLLNIASISKTITGCAVMQLRDAGAFALDDDVSGILPFPVRNPRHPDKPITVRHLLSHCSSIEDGDAYGEGYDCGDPTVPLEAWVRGYVTPGGTYYDARGNYLRSAPGERMSYSNVGYGVLGYLVEAASGQPFNEYCRMNISGPLGMKESGWLLSEIDSDNHARGHVPQGRISREDAALLEDVSGEGDWLPYCLYSFTNYPDGTFRTSVEELSLFMRAMINGGTLGDNRILEEATVREMLVPQSIPKSSSKVKQGLTWESPAEGVWQHSGGDPGVNTLAQIIPSEDIGMVAFSNGPTDGLVAELAPLLLELARTS